MSNNKTNLTKQTYASKEGALAFKNKEDKTHTKRFAEVYNIIDDIDLKNLKILDVGCGFGRDVIEFRKQGAEAYGIDISQNLLNMAPENKQWFKQLDVLENPIPFNTSFNIIWCCAFFVHIPRQNMPYILKKLWDKLETGGILVISTKKGNGEKINYNLGETLGRLMVYYQKEEILSELKKLGAIQDRQDNTIVRLATGDEKFVLRVKKPKL